MPAGVPADVVRKVAADVQKVMASAETRERFVALGAIASPGTPADLQRMFDKEFDTWSRLIGEIKLQAD